MGVCLTAAGPGDLHVSLGAQGKGSWAGSKDEAGAGGSWWERGPQGWFPTPSDLSQTLLLEKLRVARRPANEATFNVFYYLLACPDSALR